MFSFLKKKEKETPLREAVALSTIINPIVMNDVVVDEEPSSSLNPLVENKGISTLVKNDVSIDAQIYNDVYSAQELLLQEAKSILDKAVNVNEEKYVLLEEMNRLGFANAEEVKAFNKYKDKLKHESEISEAIEYYKRTYPLNRFIDMKSVNVICEKYGLVLSTVNKYIAEIPLKNQKEIVNFRIKESDIRFPKEVYPFRAPMLSRLRSRAEPLLVSEKMVCGKDLLIIAPKHKFDTRGLIQDGNVLKIDDPIVLQPVNKGFLIVSSWGLEAGDELVINSINN